MGKAASLCYFRYKFYLLKIGFMKTQRLLQLLMILASGFFFQCTSDPIPGPPGADGADGIDGIDGVDGVDGTASCISCHSNTKREPLLAQFRHLEQARTEFLAEVHRQFRLILPRT